MLHTANIVLLTYTGESQIRNNMQKKTSEHNQKSMLESRNAKHLISYSYNIKIS